jgi:hypothetical protein
VTATFLGRRLALARVVTPLGVRFWDAALDAPVDDALVVRAFRADAPSLGARAFRTASGVYAFGGLPGLQELERPDEDAPVESPASPPWAADFVVAVRDDRERYLPMTFTVRLPLPAATRGLLLHGTPGGARVPLFPSPARAVPPGLSAVRAELWEIDGADGARPASHAALRVEVGGATWTGIADAAGRALVLFPTPTASRLSLGSPAGSGSGGDVLGQSWPVVARAAWDPDRQRFPLAGASGAAASWAATPSVKSVLDEQPAASLFEAGDASPADALHAELPYTRELVLRTRRADAHSEDAGRLWLSRGASPP